MTVILREMARGSLGYGVVRTAVLVLPTTLPVAVSVKTAKMRLFAGSKGTLPCPWTKNEKVGVSPGPIPTVTVDVGALRQEPLPVVWHTATLIGRLPLSVLTWMFPAAPTLNVATAKAAAPLFLGMSTISEGLTVAASAMTSGPGPAVDTIRRVLTLVIGVTGNRLAPTMLKRTSVGAKGALGVKAMTKFWMPPGGISTGLSGAPVKKLLGLAV